MSKEKQDDPGEPTEKKEREEIHREEFKPEKKKLNPDRKKKISWV